MEGIISIVNSFKNATVWRRKAKALNPIEAYKEVDPNAKKQYSLAQQMFNSRLPSAAQAEQNIMANQANNQSNVSRNATDGATALVANAAGQAQSDQSFKDLAIAETAYKGDMLGNLNNQSVNLQNEGNMVHADKVRRFNDNTARKDAYTSAYQSLKTQGINDLNGLVQKVIMSIAGGMGGGGGGMMGGAGGAAGGASGGGGMNMSTIMGMFGGAKK